MCESYHSRAGVIVDLAAGSGDRFTDGHIVVVHDLLHEQVVDLFRGERLSLRVVPLLEQTLRVELLGEFGVVGIKFRFSIDRRVLKGECIPHEEKVFSIFEPHTEWICKGKAGVPVELGLRVLCHGANHR